MLGSDLRPVTPMALVTATLERLRRRAEQLPGAHELLPDLGLAHALATGLDPYLSRCTTAESGALALLADRTLVQTWDSPTHGAGVQLEPEMLSGHVEGQLLRMLIGLTRAVRVLEIGLFTGYSALAMAQALPPEGELIACEIDPGAAAVARQLLDGSPTGAKVDIRVGPAMSTLRELAEHGHSFDMIFLDADKTGYTDYLHLLIDTPLLAAHGLLCVDNTLLQGEPYLPGGPSTTQGRAIAEFNDDVCADPRLEQVMLPLRDGLTLIRRIVT